MGARTVWSLPPIEKIPEAYSAIADNRISFYEGYAIMRSSDLKREYTITFDNDVYTSNDNASYYRGYIGYPVIAVMIKQGKIKVNSEIIGLFSGINWKELNTRYKNKYEIVVNMILEDLASKGNNIDDIKKEIERSYDQLKEESGKIRYKRSKLQPPK